MREEAPGELRVVSWNIHEGVPVTRGKNPLDELEAALAGSDLVGLQEVALTPDGEYTEFSSISRVTGLEECVTFPNSASTFFSDRRMGIVIMSRWPVTEVRRALLPNPRLCMESGGAVLRSHDKGVLAVKISASGSEIWFASVHVFPFYLFDRDAWEEEFDAVWQKFAELVDDLGATPLLLSGDFNTDHRSLLTGKVARQLSRGITGIPTYRGIESDDILYTNHFDVIRTQVVPNFSDHDFCACEFKLR